MKSLLVLKSWPEASFAYCLFKASNASCCGNIRYELQCMVFQNTPLWRKWHKCVGVCFFVSQICIQCLAIMWSYTFRSCSSCLYSTVCGQWMILVSSCLDVIPKAFLTAFHNSSAALDTIVTAPDDPDDPVSGPGPDLTRGSKQGHDFYMGCIWKSSILITLKTWISSCGWEPLCLWTQWICTTFGSSLHTYTLATISWA